MRFDIGESSLLDMLQIGQSISARSDLIMIERMRREQVVALNLALADGWSLPSAITDDGTSGDENDAVR